MLRNRLLAMVAVLALLAMPGAEKLHGELLWDQGPDVEAPAFVDQNFPDFPDFSTFTLNDVVFDSAVNIDSVTTYFTNDFLTWPQDGAGTGTLNFFSEALSTADDPFSGTTVAVDFLTTEAGISVTASGLDLDLLAGTYWVGLTPDLGFGDFGQEFHQGAFDVVGAESQSRNPGGGFEIGTEWVNSGKVFGGVSWDAALTINGTAVPEPSTLAMFGLLAVFAAPRRRR